MPQYYISIVVPLYNEAENVSPLLTEINDALINFSHPWEALFIDDGSSDDTAKMLEQEVQRYDYMRYFVLQRNFGQTAAMQAGIDQSRGNVIVTLDGDLQNDPKDIPELVAKLINEDLDLVVGWRKQRQDHMINRKLPSKIANKLIAKVTSVALHDYGCSLKVYRSAVIKNVRLYGEMHRFIPVWMSLYTSPSRIKELAVNHRARQHGYSKYGIGRTFRVIVDLLAVYFFQRFISRPSHFFGKIGLISGALGGAGLFYLLCLKIFTAADIGDRPLFLTSILFVLTGVQFLSVGVLAEMISRTYFSMGKNPSYIIRKNHQDEGLLKWHETTLNDKSDQ